MQISPKQVTLAVQRLAMTLTLLTFGAQASAQSYADEAAAFGLDIGGGKDGGLAFGDLNDDGCTDALVNTDNALNSVLLFQTRGAAGCTGAFVDVTDTNAEGLGERRRQRSAIMADLNNDGALDLVVNTFPNLDIYLSSGGDSPTFGDADQDPSQSFNTWPAGGTTGINTEGVTAADFDGDGDIDLAIESHQFGIRLLDQTGVGSGVFADVVPAVSGLPGNGNNGDYAAAADLNGDGRVDLVMRRPGGTALNQSDLFFNTGLAAPRFRPSNEIAEASNNGAKGGVAICDFNNDGLLDVFWTPNVLYLQDDVGTFTSTTSWSPTAPPGTVRGVTCFDADNDGDQDLFLTSTGGGRQLYINDGGASFIADNRGISGSGEGLGAVALDIDLDGDLDLAVNTDGSNELWRQSALPALQDEYLAVRALHVNGDDSTRPANGTTARLETCGGRAFGPRLTADAGGGRGSIHAGPMHFGLDGRSNVPVVVALRFPGSAADVRIAVTPSALVGYRELVVRRGMGSNLDACPDADGDDVPDAADPDADNDGVLDLAELGADLSGDRDGDGVPDWADPDVVACTDLALPAGRCDELPIALDVDQDGVPNHLDLDSDGDGLFDTVESGAGLDADFDGIPDNLNDGDGDGLIDDADAAPADPSSFAVLVTPASTDSDGRANFLDRDSDGDGISDALESGGADANGDGVPDACTDVDSLGRCNAGSRTSAARATSGGAADYVDTDSDGDGLLDSVEAYDESGDGTLNGAETRADGTDGDGDGIDDAFDPDSGGTPVTTPFAPFRDSNGNGVPRWRETCGDGYVRGVEACDDGDANDANACSNLCLRGITVTCNDDALCASGLCDDDGTCQSCNDSASGMATDEGCSAGAPACVKDGGTATCSPCDDDSMAVDQGCGADAPLCRPLPTPVCVECIVDGDCDTGTCSAGACTGCTMDSECPGSDVCDTDAVCVVCVDSDGAPDRGCDDELLPICLGTSGAGTAGTACGECAVDSDCASGVCDAASNMCIVCRDGGEGTDPGCTAPRAVCDTRVADGMCVECLVDDDCRGGSCGSDNECEGPDNDRDGIPDSEDIDDDNDGIPDVDEGRGTDFSIDTDADGVPDYADPDEVMCEDLDPDGACDVLPQSVDEDRDGIPNHFDLDADGDGLVDALEGHDANGDGVADTVPPAMFADEDGDGLQDTYDADSGGTAAPLPDLDGDDIPNFLDVDSDGDAIPDAYEAFDSNADGFPERFPRNEDRDQDGIDDAFDPDFGAAPPESPDFDDDTHPNYIDKDSDNDGIFDKRECPEPTRCFDADGDGAPNHLDADADNDGVPDLTEGHDGNSDGIPDRVPGGVDANNNGLDDVFDNFIGGIAAPRQDTDGDGDADYLDADDDDDGIVTASECPSDECPDADSDGMPDYLDVDPADEDTDGDGISDRVECGGDIAGCVDTDGDGMPNFMDDDDDDDGVPTRAECPSPRLCAADGDGVPNHLDLDSDDDGIRDAIECERQPCVDTDGDGMPDLRDLDADNDGAADATEGHDSNADGIADVSPSGRDENGNGLDDAFDGPEGGVEAPTPDTDGDDTADWRDTDDDGDSVPSAAECGASCMGQDADADGRPDYLDVDGPATDEDMDGVPDRDECADLGSPDTCPDTDGDGTPDFRDPDDDDDGIPTANEDYDGNGYPADEDTDGDGTPDYLDPDDDDDGIPTADECADAASCADTDMDGAPDYLDVCGDGERSNWNGVNSWEECDDGNTAFGDGCRFCRLEESVLDDDMDGIPTAIECPEPGNILMPSTCPDSDGDGMPDFNDTDDDNDGVLTMDELADDLSRMDTDMDGVFDDRDTDDDGDGLLTENEAPDPDGDGDVTDAQDSDDDGIPDYLDRDDDGDGVFTRFEAPDDDGNGAPDDERDTDGDGTPDYLDPDDDGDDVPTAEEGPDPNGDGDPADAEDTDGDGTPDYLDPDGSPSGSGGISGGAQCSADGSRTRPWPWLILLLAFAVRRYRPQP